MNTTLMLTLGLMLALPADLRAEEAPDPALAGLQKAASDFVEAYNKKDAAAIASLFTEQGEMCDLEGDDLASGRDQIRARYEEIFAEETAPSIAIEVKSVRIVAPALAIEDGTVHLTPPGENEPPRSTAYTAVLTKGDDDSWQIASTRSLKDATDAAGQLADLAAVITGEWTGSRDGMRLDLAFGWDESGKFLTGETLVTTADGEPQTGTIRIGWDAAKSSIVSWIFDAKGGASQGVWTATVDGWRVRAEGTTGDGEAMTAEQELKPEGKDAFVWSVSHKVIAGETQPDDDLRIVRQAPEPASN